MRDPDRRRASKRAYYERHKLKLQEVARSRYAAERDSSPSQHVSAPKRCRARTGRDTERRKASRQAYYLKNRTALLQKARERMARSRASKDAAALFARRLAHCSYRLRFRELLNIRRLNMYRKRWILKRGVSEFLKNFRGRAKAEHGQLLEHWDSETVTSLVRAQ